MNKKRKLIYGLLIASVWLCLLIWASVLAVVLNQSNETQQELSQVTEDFSWNEKEPASVETIDMDYYSFYNANSIIFSQYAEYPDRLHNVYQISGLKNKEVEKIINQKILDDFNTIPIILTDWGLETTFCSIGANLYNILSIYCRDTNNKYYGFNYDLTTGNRINFDDLFSEGANLAAILYPAFYNELHTEYSFRLLEIERGVEYYNTDPYGCSMYYCYRDDGTSPETQIQPSLKARDEYTEKIKNLEQTATNDTLAYLNSSEKNFYLLSSGPVLILEDGSTVNVLAKENIIYMPFYTRYRTSESLFENDAVGLKNYFLTAWNGGDLVANLTKEHGNYFIDFIADNDVGSDIKDNAEKTLNVARYLAEKKLQELGDSKYNYFLMDGYLNQDSSKSYLWANFDLITYRMDKSYFISTFLKAIFDGKATHANMGGNQPPKADEYDPNLVEEGEFLQYYAIVDTEGAVHDTVESIFTPSFDYETYLEQEYYKSCYYEAGICKQVPAAKEDDEFDFEIGVDGILITMKNNDGERTHTVKLSEVPPEYLVEILR